MQQITEEFRSILNSRLKLGERKKPVCRVEVDKLAFIPGEVQEIESLVGNNELIEQLNIDWSDGNSSTLLFSPIVFPAQGYSLDDITSHFGEPRSNGSTHQGIDIGCVKGTSVLAAWGGKVIYRHDNHKVYGKYVIVEHSSDISTLYAHLDNINVVVGQDVVAGEVIGLSGNTGYVMSGGVHITSKEALARGAGQHLHFEIRINGTRVDPYPYLVGSKNLYMGIEGNTKEYKIGDILIEENFDTAEWFNNYEQIGNIKLISEISYDTNLVHGLTGGLNIVKFRENVRNAGFRLKYNFITSASLDLSFTSDFAEGDYLEIYFDGRVAVKVTDFSGFGILQEIRNKEIPQGVQEISFVLYCSGGWPKRFAFDRLVIRECIPSDVISYNPTNSSILEQVSLTKKEKVELDVGRFVYSETMVLDNVVSVDIEAQEEMEASTATVVISNPDGYYSPNYNPGRFSEFGESSPWSYQVNGSQVGVLSENTPIRIYMGYGQTKIRVFTGLIDMVDIDSVQGILTITCRDMYKKLQEKVILEDKNYPEEPSMSEEIIQDLGEGYNTADRETKIVMAAQKWAAVYSVDYRLIVAIAKHETNLGTTGLGTEEKGSYVCGYGINAPDRTKYSGIQVQCRYVAKRISEAIGNEPIDKDRIEYFRVGGDLGTAYTYCPDESWTDGVWSAYQSLPQYSSLYIPSSDVELSIDMESENAPWVKSAIIHDLVDYAKLKGWRSAADDLHYPDVVIEEMYLIESNQATGKVVVAGENDGEFIEVPASSVPTVYGWMNPFVELSVNIPAFTTKVSDAINDRIQDTNYRSFCDRYGTYRLERIRYDKPVVASFTEYDDLIVLNYNIDYSRARSHLCIIDDTGNTSHFIDKEILMELKGEVRSAVVSVPWARTYKEKEEVARRMFWDMKRLCRTLQVAIPGHPELDLLDRIYIYDSTATIGNVFQIKGIHTTYSVENHYSQVIDLFWCQQDNTLY